MNEAGCACNLLTGQENEVTKYARHISSTVEMADISRRMDVMVLDEVQMLSDESRGWAWTRVLLGARASEIHCCGDPAAVELVASIARGMGDEVEIHTYTRLSPLVVSAQPMTSLSSVTAGDCVVAFSRRELFEHKREIESSTGLKCGVIYGALPPAVRREQARRFNQSEAEGRTDILVATDAIGMGLNLAIRRIVFSRIDKFDGTCRRDLTISELKQIGGRAGRFASPFPTGEVSGFKRQHLTRLKHAFESPTPPLLAAGLLPTLEQLEVFAANLVHRVFQPGMATSPSDDESELEDEVSEPDTEASLRTASSRETSSPSSPSVGLDDDDVDALRRGEEEGAWGDRVDPQVLGAGVASSNTGRMADAVDFDTDSDVEDDHLIHRSSSSPRRNEDVETCGDALAQHDWRVSSFNSAATRQLAEAACSFVPFSALLRTFFARATVESSQFFMCEADDVVGIAKLLDDVELRFRSRYLFCLCPVDLDDELCASALKRYARRFVRKGKVQVGLRVPSHPPRHPVELRELEAAHSVFDMYIWFARRFPKEFYALDEAVAGATRTQELIQEGLESMGEAEREVALQRRQTAERKQARRGGRRGKEDDAILDGGRGDVSVTDYWKSMVAADEDDTTLDANNMLHGDSSNLSTSALKKLLRQRDQKRERKRNQQTLLARVEDGLIRGLGSATGADCKGNEHRHGNRSGSRDRRPRQVAKRMR